MTDTNQASEDEQRETIERLLRFNCPNGCDGNGSYPEMSSDGEWEQGQCQWCFEYGMPARDAILALIKDETVKVRVEELERIDKANKDNGICFWFEDMKPQNNGWRNMRQYVPERIAELKAQQED